MANAVVETTEHKTGEGTGVQRVTAGPERLLLFLKDTRAEMHKIHTPTRAEVQATTAVVVVTVFLFAAYFEVVDLVFGKGIDKLLLQLTKH